jgi:hypothetical protein
MIKRHVYGRASFSLLPQARTPGDLTGGRDHHEMWVRFTLGRHSQTRLTCALRTSVGCRAIIIVTLPLPGLTTRMSYPAGSMCFWYTSSLEGMDAR